MKKKTAVQSTKLSYLTLLRYPLSKSLKRSLRIGSRTATLSSQSSVSRNPNHRQSCFLSNRFIITVVVAINEDGSKVMANGRVLNIVIIIIMDKTGIIINGIETKTKRRVTEAEMITILALSLNLIILLITGKMYEFINEESKPIE